MIEMLSPATRWELDQAHISRIGDVRDCENIDSAKLPEKASLEANLVLAGERKAPPQPAPKPRVRQTRIVPDEELALRTVQGRAAAVQLGRLGSI